MLHPTTGARRDRPRMLHVNADLVLRGPIARREAKAGRRLTITRILPSISRLFPLFSMSFARRLRLDFSPAFLALLGLWGMSEFCLRYSEGDHPWSVNSAYGIGLTFSILWWVFHSLVGLVRRNTASLHADAGVGFVDGFGRFHGFCCLSVRLARLVGPADTPALRHGICPDERTYSIAGVSGQTMVRDGLASPLRAKGRLTPDAGSI